MDAAIYGRTRQALELLDGGADPQAVDEEGRTALFHAIIQGSPVAFLLLERTNRLDAVDAQGENVLHVAVRYRQKRCFYAILNHPGRPDLNARTRQGATALLIAVFARQNDLAQELVRAGADVNIADDAGVTPLMAAAAAGKRSDPHLVKSFLEHGANVHAKDVMGRTALFYAAGKGWVDTVSLLLDAGASSDAADATGHRVMDYTFGDGIPEERERIRRLLSMRQ